MKHAELVTHLATATGQSQSAVRDVLRELAATVGEQLASGETVQVSRLGSFTPRWSGEGVLRDVQTGRKRAYDGRWVPRFRASSTMKAAMASSTPSLLKDPEHQNAWRLAEALIGDLAVYHGGRAPRGLYDDAPAHHVDGVCADAFGPAWQQARTTFEETTPAHVREARDHLALSARARWGTRR
ncbi:MAG: HU family DNA-binding protein [Alphaproteobacteria bacterium]|nr:HU family DNA-binding protein [Alphaproteobacteria bacterium]